MSANIDKNMIAISKWAKRIDAHEVFLLTNRDIKAKPTLFGEDYYINTLVGEIEKIGVAVKISLLRDGKIEFNGSRFNNLTEIVSYRSIIIIHNLSPYYALLAKFTKKCKVIVPVYFINNKVASAKDNLKSRLGLFFWQFFVDEYVVASVALLKKMRRIGIHNNLTFLYPYYACPYCNRDRNEAKNKSFEISGLTNLECVYIGSVSPKRFSFKKTISLLSKDSSRQYRLQVFTQSEIKPQKYVVKNVKVEVNRRLLSEEEKCRILSDSHIFIAPAEGTTMEPPISVIEAKWHGNHVLHP